MRGRKRQSASIREAKGNPGKQARLEATAAKPAADRKPAPLTATSKVPGGGTPRELTREGKRVWNMVVPQLHEINFFDPLDRGALARYCDAIAEYWKVTRQLRKMKYTYEVKKVGGGTMLRFNPLFMVQDRLGRRLDVLEDRFGMTTRSRQEIMYRLANQVPQLPLGKSHDADAPEPDHKSPIGILNRTPEDGPQRVH